MSDFSLTLVLQFKTSKIIKGMANISIKCGHSKNANQILMCPVNKGNFCRKCSHFFFLIRLGTCFGTWPAASLLLPIWVLSF